MNKHSTKHPNLIRDARRRANMTQIDLALAVGEAMRKRLKERGAKKAEWSTASCDQASISRYENGRGIPHNAVALALKEVFKEQGLTLEQILDPPVTSRRPRKVA